MWTINSYNIFTLRTPGGDRFTEFVDALIKAEAYIQNISLSEVSTNLRTNLGDKGVDAEVRQSMSHRQTEQQFSFWKNRLLKASKYSIYSRKNWVFSNSNSQNSENHYHN